MKQKNLFFKRFFVTLFCHKYAKWKIFKYHPSKPPSKSSNLPSCSIACVCIFTSCLLFFEPIVFSPLPLFVLFTLSSHPPPPPASSSSSRYLYLLPFCYLYLLLGSHNYQEKEFLYTFLKKFFKKEFLKKLFGKFLYLTLFLFACFLLLRGLDV